MTHTNTPTLFSDHNVRIISPILLVLTLFLGFVPASSFAVMKMGVIALTIVSFSHLIVRGTIKKKYILFLFTFLFFCVFYCWWGLLSSNTEPKWIFRETSSFALCCFLAVFISCTIDTNTKLFSRYISFSYWSLLLYSVLKLSLLILVFTGIIDVKTIVSLIKEIAPSMVGQQFSYGVSFIRLQSGNDVIVLFHLLLLPLVEKENILHKRFVKIFWIICTISLVLTLTRFIWLTLLFAIIAKYTLPANDSKSLIKSLLKIIVPFVAVSLMIYAIFALNLTEIVSRRFSDLDSLATKMEQSIRLLTAISSNILLGTGMGAYLPEYIRNDTLPFVYENQILSFVLKFGFIGAIPLTYFAFIWLRSVKPMTKTLKIDIFRIYLLFCGLFFLFSSFFNPYLLSLNASMIFATTYVLAKNMSRGHASYNG